MSDNDNYRADHNHNDNGTNNDNNDGTINYNDYRTSRHQPNWRWWRNYHDNDSRFYADHAKWRNGDRTYTEWYKLCEYEAG